MSSIIDALKKSDQNRNNENNSDLNHINFSKNADHKSRRGFWLLVLALLLIAFGVFGYQQNWHTDLMTYVKSWSSQSKITTPVADSSDLEKPEIQPDANKNKNSQANQLTPPKQSEVKAQVAKNQAANDGSNNEIEKLTEVKPERDQAGNLTEVKDSITVTTEEKTPPNEQIKPVVVANEAEANKAKDRSLEPKLKQDYLLIHQIDYAIRKDIPEIKINIHIYDPVPENRMVLINGERFNIGNTINETVSIEDIVQEGIVVTFEDIKFLIPK